MKRILTAMAAMLMIFSFAGARAAEDPFFTSYDITEHAAVWARLMEEVTVLDAGEKELVYPLDAPNGSRLFSDKMGGYIYGKSAAVRVLSGDEGGWTLIQAYDDHDRQLPGYVKTRLLRKVKPVMDYSLVVDKLTQRLYIFRDGRLFSELLISTGLVNDAQPYNETASGEYLAVSWTGGFRSDNMWCDLALRFNGGDLFHEVPGLLRAYGSKDYRKFEPLLGARASHGCIRVQRLRNLEGVNMRWLWDNLKVNTKVLVWDDEGRRMPYPDDGTVLYYNPEGGQNYHAVADCPGVRSRYLPLSPFTYGELENEQFARLTPCGSCAPALRKSVIAGRNAGTAAAE